MRIKYFLISLIVVSCNTATIDTTTPNFKEKVLKFKNKLNAEFTFGEDSTSFEYKKRVVDNGNFTTEEMFVLDSINKIEFIKLSVVNMHNYKDSILVEGKVFSTIDYDVVYGLFYTKDEILGHQEFGCNNAMKNILLTEGKNLESIVVEIRLLRFDSENNRIIRHSMHKQFKKSPSGKYIEEPYSIENKDIEKYWLGIIKKVFSKFSRD